MSAHLNGNIRHHCFGYVGSARIPQTTECQFQGFQGPGLLNTFDQILCTQFRESEIECGEREFNAPFKLYSVETEPHSRAVAQIQVFNGIVVGEKI